MPIREGNRKHKIRHILTKLTLTELKKCLEMFGAYSEIKITTIQKEVSRNW